MKQHKIKSALCAILLLLPMLPMHASAIIFFDPANYAQNYVTAFNSTQALIKQATQLENQVKSLKYQWQNLSKLKEFNQRDFQQLLSDLNKLVTTTDKISQQAQVIDKELSKSSPNFNKAQSLDYKKSYQDWNKARFNTLHTSLQTVKTVMNTTKQEQDLLAKLQTQSKGAQGAVQIGQVQAALMLENIHQLQQLRLVLAEQTKAQLRLEALKASQTSFEQQSIDKMTQAPYTRQVIPTTHFGLMPTMP